ncbi:hypothetical protein MAR_019474 [Mya arenaria]|uniref:Uncharacterized protein n=1 Tax=Mya arenaria TaxID=6604 RepID=A0ABY7E579_MYAAR|nr:hypothetical protein MAR_019474 [Mya arenaria]
MIIGGCDPYERKLAWTQNVDILSLVTYPDIVNYLLFTQSAYSADDLKSYKSLEAYRQFVFGWFRYTAGIVKGGHLVGSAFALVPHLMEYSFEIAADRHRKDGELELKPEHMYNYQVQSQLGVSKHEVGYFVVLTANGLHIEAIIFDIELWDKNFVSAEDIISSRKLKSFTLGCQQQIQFLLEYFSLSKIPLLVKTFSHSYQTNKTTRKKCIVVVAKWNMEK